MNDDDFEALSKAIELLEIYAEFNHDVVDSAFLAALEILGNIHDAEIVDSVIVEREYLNRLEIH